MNTDEHRLCLGPAHRRASAVRPAASVSKLRPTPGWSAALGGAVTRHTPLYTRRRSAHRRTLANGMSRGKRRREPMDTDGVSPLSSLTKCSQPRPLSSGPEGRKNVAQGKSQRDAALGGRPPSARKPQRGDRSTRGNA